MPRNSEADLRTRSRGSGIAPSAEGRDLTAERAHPHGRARRCQAKSQHKHREADPRDRPAGGGVRVRDRHRPEPRRIRAAARATCSSSRPGYQKIADPAGRGAARGRTGPVEVSSSHARAASRARCWKTTAWVARAAGWSRRSTSPGIVYEAVRAARRPRRFRPVDDDRQPSALRRRRHRHVGRCGRGRGAARSPSRTIDMAEIVEPIKKIATMLPISDEMLEDAPSRSRATSTAGSSLFVSIEEERQLLRGTGT